MELLKAQLVVPMSGMGKRFLEAGYKKPKYLIEVNGKTILEHVVDMYPNVQKLLFIINRTHFESSEYELMSFFSKIAPAAQVCVIEEHKKGPGWAVHQAQAYLAEDIPIILNYCDFASTFNLENLKKLISRLKDGEIDGAIPTYTGFHPHMIREKRYAYLLLDAAGNLEGIQEKASYTNNPMREPASSGAYIFSCKKVLIESLDEQIEENYSLNGEFYLSLTYKSLIRRGAKVVNFELDQFLQWGTPQDLGEFYFWETIFTQLLNIEPHKKTQGEILILAAGLGSRFRRLGYTELKPLILVNRAYMVDLVLSLIEGDRKYFFFRSDLEESEVLDRRCEELGIEALKIPHQTSGQAASAQIALEMLTDHLKPITILACDSLISIGEVLPKSEVTVWLSLPSPFAIHAPENFSWVRINEDSMDVLDWRLKQAPPNESGWYVVTGSFSFSSIRLAKTLIRELLSTEVAQTREVFLDEIIGLGIAKGLKLKGLLAKFFLSLGTPEELESFKYWQRYFDTNQHYLYTLEADSLVNVEMITSIRRDWLIDPVGKKIVEGSQNEG